jgi:hypothetical protein
MNDGDPALVELFLERGADIAAMNKVISCPIESVTYYLME